MAKSTQVLNIDPPNEITFKGPFTDVVTSQIRLTNPSDRQVCFKVKTTAPKQYCVRPNSGLIPPSGSVLVSVMLQPFDYNAEERNKHKFMVQTAFMPDGEHSLDTIWKNTPSGEMMDSKLRVVFDVPSESLSTPEKSVVAKPVQVQQPVAAVKPTTQNIEAELRSLIDEKKRYMHQLTQIEQENTQLRDRLKKFDMGLGASELLNASGAGSSSIMQADQVRFTLKHLILICIVAVFVGLILGKSF